MKLKCIFFIILLFGGGFAVEAQSLGDVDNSGTVDIVDALSVAQYSVGLNPSNFNPDDADVDCSDSINILDALLIAQLSVDLISSFPCAVTPTPTTTSTPTGLINLSWDFATDTEGWNGNFADYPEGQESLYELQFSWNSLPAELEPGGGLKIGGNNHSDDLFMYITREITGLQSLTAYSLNIVADIGTNAPADCSGIGGAPGTSVYFKIGAVNKAPITSPDASGWLRLNLDKGNQASSGADMKAAGDISNTLTCPDITYQKKTLSLSGFQVTSSANGTIWVLLGTDSGFEGTTVLYYDKVSISLKVNTIVNNNSVKILIPAYFYPEYPPNPSKYWGRMAAQAEQMPGRLYVIANPASGPGESIDPVYTTAISYIQTHSGKVIGYITSSYAKKSIDVMKAEVDKMYNWYGVDGIFIDEQINENKPERYLYYQEIYSYIKSKKPDSVVVNNPGINTYEGYLMYDGKRNSDVLCIYEGTGTGFDAWAPQSWYAKYSRNNFYVLPYATGLADWKQRLDFAITQKLGWIYITDDVLNDSGSPWDTLPNYFEDFCGYIRTLP